MTPVLATTMRLRMDRCNGWSKRRTIWNTEPIAAPAPCYEFPERFRLSQASRTE
jgi:hypothetical protein